MKKANKGKRWNKREKRRNESLDGRKQRRKFLASLND